MLSLLYQAVRRGDMTRNDAELRLNYVRGLRLRLLRDCVPSKRRLEGRQPARVA
jgi:hypothetical protein